jgi:hypothetical protein
MLLTRLTLEQLARDNAELSVVPAEHVFRAVSELGNAADARGVAAGQVTDKASEGVPASLAMRSTSIYTTCMCASSSNLVVDMCLLRQDVRCAVLKPFSVFLH